MAHTLIIDSSSPVALIALFEGEQLKAAELLEPLTHETLLATKVSEYFQLSNHGIDEILMGEGPGSFTGLRISFSLVAGIKLCKEIKVTLVPSLCAFASYYIEDKDHDLLFVLDAGKSEYFCQELRNLDMLSGNKGTLGEVNLRAELSSDSSFKTITFRPENMGIMDIKLLANRYYLMGKFHGTTLPSAPLSEYAPKYGRAVLAKTRKERLGGHR